ncbi:MAG: restriction endonuclease subunit S [Paraburkholderia sp.]|uniref:restriction endonuclease subunit S n=1 Tax=Paraburkholderia sp. TaxID=1926495 RepID=UPI003C410423
MKTLIKKRSELQTAGRWDIDFHLPPEEISKFPAALLKRVDEVATITKDKRDPSRNPDDVFQYIDISSVDVMVGGITTAQEVEGSDAPSRARKVVCAFDILISTCRPTRGAVAVVPPKLHNQIASTGFSVVRAKPGINPFYLHYALRLPSTLEQFRKWSTGSSYPAILDEDVAKTLIPVPTSTEQDEIAQQIVRALQEREQALEIANDAWHKVLDGVAARLGNSAVNTAAVDMLQIEEEALDRSVAAITALLKELPPLTTDRERDVRTLALL